MDIGNSVKGSGERAEDSEWMDHVARAGLVAYGVVHLLIVWVTFQLAFGDWDRKASTSGAFHALAEKPFGTAALWALAVGLVLLVVWRVTEAAFGHQDEGSDRTKKRAGSALKAVLYGLLAASALQILLTSGGGGGKSLTGTVMSWPGGQWLVVVGGLAVIGYGGWTAYRGWSEKFLENLDAQGRIGEVGDAYKWFGKIGYIVKGLAIALVGVLVVRAGWTHSGKEDQGLGDALRTLLQQPFGPWLVAAVGLGFGCYGLFCFARARHLDR